MPANARRPESGLHRGRRVAHCLALLLLGLTDGWAAEDSPTARLTRVADCIREADELKGARRETFMNECLASKARAAGVAAPKTSLPAAAVVAPPAAPLVMSAPAQSDGLPPQERILGCASGSKAMQGEARTRYLKQCLSGRLPEPPLVASSAHRQSACAAQAKGQSADEHQAFMTACLAQRGTRVSAGATSQPAAVVVDAAEPRRRAACNVSAGDKQGEARKGYIEQCIATVPSASTAATPVPNAGRVTTEERLLHSKRCADEARARIGSGAAVMAYMNTCMARP